MRIKCPLCPTKRQKKFSFGRGLRMHLKSKHSYHLEKLSCIGVDDKISLMLEELNKNQSSEETVVLSQVNKWILFARQGNSSGLQKLMDDGSWYWNRKDKHGSIAENYCAGSGKLECLKFCINLRKKDCSIHGNNKSGIKCICPENEIKLKRNDGRYSIHWAVRNNKLTIIEYLLHTKWNSISHETYDGTLPIHLAAFQCHVDLLVTLKTKYEADLRAENNWNCGLPHFLGLTNVKDKHKIESTCQYLFLTNKISVSNRNKEDHTIIHKSATKGNTTILSWLLSASKDNKSLRNDIYLILILDMEKICDLARRCEKLEFLNFFKVVFCPFFYGEKNERQLVCT